MNQFTYKQFAENHLPHIQPPEATLFVTFRLAGSIPKVVLRKWEAEKNWLLQETGQINARTELDSHQAEAHQERLRQFQRQWFRRFEEILHQADSRPCWLENPKVAEIVAKALSWRDGKVYRLDAYCIMCNHVHAVFAPLLTEAEARQMAKQTRLNVNKRSDTVLSVIMQSLKGYTARQANQVLNRSGQFWEHESYDHVVRPGEFERIVSYVLNNPVKAGLVRDWREWQWSYVRQTVSLPQPTHQTQ